jgi:hypothetical protein
VSVAAKDPQGVALLSSISAFLGAIFAATRVLLAILERFDDTLVVPVLSASPPPYDADKDKNTGQQQDKEKAIASPTQTTASGGGQQREGGMSTGVSPHHGDNAGYQPINGVASPVNSILNSNSTDQLVSPSMAANRTPSATTMTTAPVIVELIKPHAITLHLDDNKDADMQHYHDDPVLATPRSKSGAPKSRSNKGNRSANEVSPRKRSATTKSRPTTNDTASSNGNTNGTAPSSSRLTPRRGKLTSIPPSATDEAYEEGIMEDGDDIDPSAEMKRQSRKQHQQPRTVDACNVRMCM